MVLSEAMSIVGGRAEVVLGRDPERVRARLSAPLEGRSVEEPDRESPDRDDPDEDQDEGDIRLTFGIVLGKTVHLGSKARRGFQDRRRPQW